MRLAVWLLIFCSASNVCGEIDWPVLNLVSTRSSLPFRTVITHAGDGSGRLFMAGQAGDIVIVSGGKLQNFLEIFNRVKWDGSSKSEQGFLGVAFPPDFKSKRHFYVNYTRQPDGATVISRFSLTADDNVADASSEQVLLTIPQPTQQMHKGGQLAFGPDGYLYVGMGDGGPWFDPENRAQDTGSLLGKILRIDVEGDQSPYGIPASNPFVNNPAYKPEIWALGLRNPWRFSFDRETGDLFIGDVGESLREEIDFQPRSSPGGENYGWRIKEGSLDHILPEGGIGVSLIAPIIEYDRQSGGCIIGGYVYRGTNYPRMKGVYFYADYVSRRMWGAKRIDGQWKTQELMKSQSAIRTFGEDEQGNLYFADYGMIYKIEDTEKIEPVTLGIKGTTSQSEPIKLEWASTTARSYQVQSSEDLYGWSNVGVALKGTGASLSVEVEVVGKSRFYRVLAVPAPVI